MDKKYVRKAFLKKLNSLDKNFVKSTSEEIISKIIDSNEYKNSKNIFVFVSFKNEVFTHDFIKNSISDKKNIYIPYINESEKKMYVTALKNFDDLEIGFYNILSLPQDKLKIENPEILDLTITPGVVFGEDFYRIGYGGGYYDKFFSENNITSKKLGICYDFQLIECVVHDDYDIKLDKIITEERIIERETL